jgi:hypothetical protein
MIARTWQGRVPASKADAYYEYLQRTGLAHYQATPGNLGVLVQRRVEGRIAIFVLTTLWDSVESIQRFAGEEYDKARYYPEDPDFLLEQDRYVTHAEVLMAVLRARPDPPSGATG